MVLDNRVEGFRVLYMPFMTCEDMNLFMVCSAE